jgi:hypothetical protein
VLVITHERSRLGGYDQVHLLRGAVLTPDQDAAPPDAAEEEADLRGRRGARSVLPTDMDHGSPD